MKTTKFIFALLTFVIFASCSEENDTPSTEQSLLLGEWNLEEYNYSGTSTAALAGTAMTTSYIGELGNIDARLLLNSDNSYSTEGSYMVALTISMMGETITQYIPFPDVSATGIYTVEDNRITIGNIQLQQPQDLDMTVGEGTIVELTANRLVIAFDQVFSSEMHGAEVNISIQGQQVYSR